MPPHNIYLCDRQTIRITCLTCFFIFYTKKYTKLKFFQTSNSTPPYEFFEPFFVCSFNLFMKRTVQKIFTHKKYCLWLSGNILYTWFTLELHVVRTFRQKIEGLLNFSTICGKSRNLSTCFSVYLSFFQNRNYGSEKIFVPADFPSNICP